MTWLLERTSACITVMGLVMFVFVSTVVHIVAGGGSFTVASWLDVSFPVCLLHENAVN